MLSYKQYKALNESVMPSFNLGVTNPTNLGLSSPFADYAEAKKMAKKKSKKKMFGDEEEETGDGEMVPPASEKDEPDVDVDMGDDEDSGDCGMKCAKSKKKSKKKMWSDEDDAAPEEEGEEDMGDEEDMDDMGDEDIEGEPDEDEESGEALAGKGSMGDKGPMSNKGPMFSKKSKKKCGSGEDMSDEDMDDEEEGDDVPEEGDEMQFSKKKSKKKLKKEATEEEKWWNSVHDMMGPAPDTKYGDGWTEYQSSEFTPIDTENLTQAIRPEPQAGEFGFAPQKQMGSFFS